MEDLRKLAAEIVGKAALEERFGTPTLSALDQITLHKLASADPELLRVASLMGTGDTLKAYEELGGAFELKEAAQSVERVKKILRSAHPDSIKAFQNGRFNTAAKHESAAAASIAKQQASKNWAEHAAEEYRGHRSGVKALKHRELHEAATEEVGRRGRSVAGPAAAGAAVGAAGGYAAGSHSKKDD
jgi:hypothetical protein